MRAQTTLRENQHVDGKRDWEWRQLTGKDKRQGIGTEDHRSNHPPRYPPLPGHRRRAAHRDPRAALHLAGWQSIVELAKRLECALVPRTGDFFQRHKTSKQKLCLHPRHWTRRCVPASRILKRTCAYCDPDRAPWSPAWFPPPTLQQRPLGREVVENFPQEKSRAHPQQRWNFRLPHFFPNQLQWRPPEAEDIPWPTAPLSRVWDCGKGGGLPSFPLL